jgi:magnesium transporter
MTSQITFYLSRLIGSRCVDANGKAVGVLKDLIIENQTHTEDDSEPIRPRVLAFQIKQKGKLAYLNAQFIHIEKKKENYKIICDKVEHAHADVIHHALFLVDNVLDKQIVDINGRKLVRVNDVRLVAVPSGIYALAVDVGVEGLLRRIGIAKQISTVLKPFSASIPSKFFLWDDIAAVDYGHSGIKLSKTVAKLETLHPSDVADIIEDFGKHEGSRVFEALDEEHAADVLEELEPHAQVQIIESLSVEKAADVLEKMPADEVADLLEELGEEKAEQLLMEMDRESSDEVRELLEYPGHSVGSIMSTDYFVFHENTVINDVLIKLREQKPEANTIYALFVIDKSDKFLSVVTLRDLVVAPPDKRMKDIMKKKPISVFDDDDIDVLGDLVSKYNLLAVPVINKQRQLEGMVVIDDIVEDLLNKGKTK